MRAINALREQKVWRRNASWSHRVWSRRHEVFLDDQPRGSSTAFFALRIRMKVVDHGPMVWKFAPWKSPLKVGGRWWFPIWLGGLVVQYFMGLSQTDWKPTKTSNGAIQSFREFLYGWWCENKQKDVLFWILNDEQGVATGEKSAGKKEFEMFRVRMLFYFPHELRSMLMNGSCQIVK